MTLQSLSTYVNRQSRSNLLFTSDVVESMTFVDIGRHLSSEIGFFLEKKRLGMIAEDALKRILNRSLNRNAEIGEYIAIKNIGILFEPALHLDVKAILKNWSRDHVLIVKHEGEIRDGIFYLAANSAKQFVNLREITYKSIA